jgi:histidine ammonia-lyase
VALRALAALDAIVDDRLGGTSDSPVFLAADAADGDGLYPSGAFHAVDVVVALETLVNALCHVVNLIEKRLHRLLDERSSGLPDQLTTRPGVQAGVVALHKTVVGLVAEARTLAVPASVHALDTSNGQEDVQSFTFLVAQRADRLLDAFEVALACELVALRQAAHLAGDRPAGTGLTEVVATLAVAVEPVERDRTLSADVRRVPDLDAAGTLSS